jgi:hypothetical protein
MKSPRCTSKTLDREDVHRSTPKKKCISFPFRHFPTRFDAGDAANDARDARDGVRRDARDGGAPSRDGGAPFEGVRGAGARKRREDEGYRRPTAKRGGFFFF